MFLEHSPTISLYEISERMIFATNITVITNSFFLEVRQCEVVFLNKTVVYVGPKYCPVLQRLRFDNFGGKCGQVRSGVGANAGAARRPGVCPHT